jgi:hypothetical protein
VSQQQLCETSGSMLFQVAFLSKVTYCALELLYLEVFALQLLPQIMCFLQQKINGKSSWDSLVKALLRPLSFSKFIPDW